MKKSDLKTGMIVELFIGDKYMVLIGEFPTEKYGNQNMIFVGINSFTCGSNYDTDMLSVHNETNFDIVRVYEPNIRGLNSILRELPKPIWSREPKTDWSKIAVDTKVYVRDDHQEWISGHFAKYINGKIFTWTNGKTSFTTSESIVAWKYAKLAKEQSEAQII